MMTGASIRCRHQRNVMAFEAHQLCKSTAGAVRIVRMRSNDDEMQFLHTKAPSVNERGRYQPFTAPIMMPLMKKRCRKG